MAGREVREYTNLSDPKDKKWGKGKDKVDDEDIAFQRMVAKGFWHLPWDISKYRCKRLQENVEAIYMEEGALDSDDLLYLKEQMEAEEDAERLRHKTEKRAFAAFKRAASMADSAPSASLPLRVEPKPKSGIRQQVLLKNILEIKPKRQRVSTSSESQNVHGNKTMPGRISPDNSCDSGDEEPEKKGTANGTNSEKEESLKDSTTQVTSVEKSTSAAAGSVLGLAYDSSDEE